MKDSYWSFFALLRILPLLIPLFVVQCDFPDLIKQGFFYSFTWFWFFPYFQIFFE